ncbi:hypothetical protein [Limimaricola cinnabarinus]|jgi:hypothetical protein|uniref:Uncharacterized protein n=1 Tax=Limimaricola cinnabarinus TaxID=1125964 RepID=A0A2G1MKG3_9RHOB|nr:hypothetical protein [Limimaricola cinnabarinus]PHP29152.1 hypothetical protein CJ301_01315 [Limimaricola cinnabarinus]
MPLVPVSLFARLILLAAPAWFARRHDPSQKAHQLFFAVIALHAMQSLLLTLRWGHGIEPAGRFAGFTAPVLPVIAYMSCRALSAPLRCAAGAFGRSRSFW